MRLCTYFDPSLSLENINSMTEYIFAIKDFSRQGILAIDDLSWMDKLNQKGIKTVLEIDILLTQKDFSDVIKKINDLKPEYLSFVRLQDPGLVQYFLDFKPNTKIQLILETGNHNIEGINTWCEYVGESLDRVVLSPEISKSSLKNYIQDLDYPVEFLGLGPVLVFYTPRKLLTHALDEDLSLEELRAIGKSEESPHKGFPLFENKHGTFMYHIKDFCLLDEIDELKKMNLAFFRFDPRIRNKFNLINEIENLIQNKRTNTIKKIKELYETDLMKGYYRVNKSDVLFPKLKNTRIKRKDLNFIGNVLETVKDHYSAIEVKENALKVGDHLKIITPEGKEITTSVKSLRDISLKDQKIISAGKVALINYKRGVWTKSSVYLAE